MITRKINGLTVLTFENLSSAGGVRHGFFTRAGGISSPPYDSLNIGFDVGDRPGHVRENRGRLAAAMKLDRLVYAHQVHGTRTLLYGEDRPAPEVPETGDAMATDLPGHGLVIQVADCQAVLLWDPVRRVAANIHSGWRGSVANIIGSTVAAMAHRFGTRPRDLVAGVGPSLGPCCAQFIHFQTEIPRELWKYEVSDRLFDFWTLSLDQLRNTGIRPERIELGGLCTRCRTDLFFSYRGEGVTGRIGAVIGSSVP